MMSDWKTIIGVLSDKRNLFRALAEFLTFHLSRCISYKPWPFRAQCISIHLKSEDKCPLSLNMQKITTFLGIWWNLSPSQKYEHSSSWSMQWVTFNSYVTMTQHGDSRLLWVTHHYKKAGPCRGSSSCRSVALWS